MAAPPDDAVTLKIRASSVTGAADEVQNSRMSAAVFAERCLEPQFAPFSRDRRPHSRALVRERMLRSSVDRYEPLHNV
jgi:hypothetical protein